ncbi:PREDICTED: zinc finger BED domain-containing protein DAYSLEEPER-like [Prunus mume]|uniref:Zinc finger BED domain-containing protein DAYSLEEPER-like n=1 Tax=Prunus mume TaxID=102107 RepID=A0ABM1LIA8_PRUMU|nr:PREDICTED: zinc finger BED domain-containing protein DAYSLEEPER-like [Prunus mume]
MSGVPESNTVTGSAKNGISDSTEENSSSGHSKDVSSFSSVSDTKVKKVVEYDQQKDLRTLAELICSGAVQPEWAGDITWSNSIFNPLFKPSFNEFETKCMEVYEEKKMETKKILGNFDGQISLSVDILRCENHIDPRCCGDYLCLSAHLVDENWKLKKRVLCFSSRSVSGPSDDSLHGHEDWGIENKIRAVTVNNGKCYKEMVEHVKRHIQEKKEFQLNPVFPVYCCGEIFRVMVQDAFDKIEDIVHKSWSTGELSTKDVIGSNDVPSPEEWKKVEGVCKIIGSIDEVSEALFYTTPLTSNVYLYHLHELHGILTKMSTDSDCFNRTIVKDMLKKFDEYLDNDMFLLLTMSAALDPRFKMRYIEFFCSEVKRKDKKTQVANVLWAMQKLFDDYVIRFPTEGESCRSRRWKRSFRVVKDYQQFIRSNDHPAKKSDLDRYLEEPVLPWSPDFNALSWWRTAGTAYPTLSRMARDFLAMPMSLSTGNGVYYTVPKPADEYIVRLKPDLMNALMCTRSWV